MKSLTKYALPLLAACIATSCSFSTKKRDQTIRLGTSHKISTCDPRKAQGLTETSIARMLFEGLTYIDENGKLFPGIATKIQISQDLKTYTFHLRDANWSNGDKVLAADFEKSWKSMLDPETKSPMAYMLFVIKGAKEFYDDKVAADAVGIKALDDKTLVVQLSSPSPYFLQLTATPNYFPVPQKWDDMHPIGNGPFALAEFTPEKPLQFVKNSHYWGNTTVTVEKLELQMMEEQELLSQFKKGNLDWIGSPLSTLTQTERDSLQNVQYAQAAGVEFLRLNTQKAPFTNPKVRKALQLAIDTKAITANILKGGQKPAQGFVPLGMGIHAEDVSYNPTEAASLFEAGLLEIPMNKAQVPPLMFTFIDADRMGKIAELIAQNIKSALNIEVVLDPQAPNAFYEKLFSQDYQIAAGSWFADYYDPMSFLSVFQTPDNGVNCTGWKNAEYSHLLLMSNLEIDPVRRMSYLQQAQDVLMEDLPIVPLFYFTFSYCKSSDLDVKPISPMGTLDIENATFITK